MDQNEGKKRRRRRQKQQQQQKNNKTQSIYNILFLSIVQHGILDCVIAAVALALALNFYVMR